MSTLYDVTGCGERFRSNMYLWVALRHFLSGDLLRELMFVVVEEVSNRELSLEQLFEERLVTSTPGLESWVLRLLPTEGELAHYLQRTVQSVAWQADDIGSPPKGGGTASQLEKAAFLDQALILGNSDFGFDERLVNNLPDENGLRALVETLRLGAQWVSGPQDRSDFVSVARAAVADLDDPVSTLVLFKHLGDLCADFDAWDCAHAFYVQCRSILDAQEIAEWATFVVHLRDLVDQSIAAAVRISSGPEAAANQLAISLASSSFNTRPTLTLNAPFDMLSATINSDTLALQFVDSRRTLLRPPLNHDSHYLHATILDEAIDNHANAARRSWAVLRRQTALGLSTESRGTMGTFARVLLNNLNHKDPGRTNREDFTLAVRLLVQSADRSAVSKLNWTDRLVGFVDEAAIELVVAHCRRHPGAALEREQTAITLFGAWIERLPEERRGLAQPMLAFVAARATNGKISPMSNRDLGIRALDTLISIAKSRPELCRDSAGAFYEAASAKLRVPTHWNHVAKSLELGRLVLGVLSESQRRDLTANVLAALELLDPKQQLWPIIRPGLEFLVADEVIVLSNTDTSIGQAVVRVIMALGTDARTEVAGLMYYLQRFKSDLFEVASREAITNNFINRLIESVGKGNSSAAAGEIQALLSVPALSGESGTTAAIQALKQVLRSATKNRPAMSFAYTYAAILEMAGRGAALAEVMGEREKQEQLNIVLGLIYDVWKQAIERPSILAPFSIPEPTGPNRTIVHNWTYASMRLAHEAGEEERMLAFLESIETPGLRAPIQLAIATGALSADMELAYDDDYAVESNDAFYSGLGRRLVRVLRAEGDAAAKICGRLLEQCLRRGPRGLDAGVLAEAHRLGIANQVDQALAHDYMLRVENDLQLRLALWPLVTGLSA